MPFEFKKIEPVYMQIVKHIEYVLASGEIRAGARIPPVRKLAADFGVNPNTAQRALKELEKKGYLFAERTKGRFVTNDEAKLDELKKSIPDGLAKEFINELRSLGLSGVEILAVINKNIK